MIHPGKNYGGSGIGLALVKELIDLHKWEIDVQSQEEKGLSFILKIPLWDSYLDDNQKIFETMTGSPSLEKSETFSFKTGR